MPFELTDNVHVAEDDQGNIRHLEHFLRPFVASNTVPADSRQAAALEATDAPSTVALTPQALAQQYLQEVAPVYQFDPNMLPESGGAEARLAEPAAGKLELTEENELMGTTTISYQQTYRGLPVWEAGISVTIQPQPMRVTASQSSVHSDLSLPEDALGAVPVYRPEGITASVLKTLLGLTNGDTPTINGTRQLIYRYDPNQRYDPEAGASSTEALQGSPPTLDLPPVPATIRSGQHYPVTEALFTLPAEGYGPVNWRAFVDTTTGAVLYLRAFVACVSGTVFRTDPLTVGGAGAPPPTAGVALLNPFRSAVTLDGLTNGSPQPLSGPVRQLVDNDPPMVVPPTQPNPPANFLYDAPTREFAAVNAYHHCDWLFRHMQGMGFNISSYFDGTTFPVPVDPCAFSDQINARAPGNTSGTGSGGFQFGLAGTPFPAVSIAADVRVVLHEFGHTILWDSVHSPNFGFAHSAGDSLAAILMDPESALRTDAVRRFHTFPWILPDRNHGRDVTTGWAWGGTNDVGGYSSEQILSTTHFRIYRSLGGDSSDVNRRKMAARQTVYLIFRAVGSLAANPVTPTPNPGVYATALMNADIGTLNFEGYRGGAFHKVIRWGFEKQGLFQPAGTPRPVTRPGAPPAVDVYINDGVDYQGNPRNGEYVFQPVHWECRDIWNRLSAGMGGGGGVHETPIVGRTNFAYVRAKNRGTQAATNVLVRGYSANPGAGLTWPGDWTPMLTPQLSVANIPSGGDVIVGPFRWIPRNVGHECMFMEVSAPGDRSNIDPLTFFSSATGPTPEWRVVPFDNNIGQRNIAPVAAGGGIRGLLSSFVGRKFKVRNPLERQARIEIRSELPKLLAERGWGVRLDQRDTNLSFSLGPGASREVVVELKPGGEFTAAEARGTRGPIRLTVLAEGDVIGGMSYDLDSRLQRAVTERAGTPPISLDHEEIEEAIRNAGEDSGESSPVEDQKEDTGNGLPANDDGAASTASFLLSQLGVTNPSSGKVNRVTLKKVLLEVDLTE